MIRFLTATLAPFAAVLTWIIIVHTKFGFIRTSEWIALLATLIIVPLLSAALALAWINRRAPRRALARNAPGSKRLIISGLFTGVFAVAATAATLTIVNRDEWYEIPRGNNSTVVAALALLKIPTAIQGSEPQDAEWRVSNSANLAFYSPVVPESLITGVATFAAAWFFAWLLPRRRPGLCVRCNYDIRYSLDAGRCPECGLEIRTN